MNIGELFLKLGVDVDNASLGAFKNQVDTLPGKLINLKNVFTTLVIYGIDRFVESTIDGTVALQNFNNQTDLSIDKLQKWQVASQLSDISLTTEDVTGSIQNLQKNLTDIRLGAGNIRPFQLMGIDIQGKEAFEVLESIRESIKGLNSATAVNLVEQTGLSPNFINVLRLSRNEFEKLGTTRFLSKEQRDTLLKLGTAITKFKIEFGLAKDAIVADLYPVWNGLLQLISKLSDGFARLTNWVIQNKTALMTFSAIISTLFVFLQPFAAAIAGIILLIEDFIVYLEGGESVIGKIIDAIKDFMTTDIFENAFPTLNSLIENLKEVIDLISSVNGFKDFSIKKMFGFGDEKEKENEKNIDIKNVFPSLDTPMFDIQKESEKSIQPASSVFNESKTASNTTSFSNNFNIQSNGNPEDVAQSVIDIQQTQFNYAYQDLDNGATI